MAVGKITSDIYCKWLPCNQANCVMGVSHSGKVESHIIPGTANTLEMSNCPR